MDLFIPPLTAAIASGPAVIVLKKSEIALIIPNIISVMILKRNKLRFSFIVPSAPMYTILTIFMLDVCMTLLLGTTCSGHRRETRFKSFQTCLNKNSLFRMFERIAFTQKKNIQDTQFSFFVTKHISNYVQHGCIVQTLYHHLELCR